MSEWQPIETAPEPFSTCMLLWDGLVVGQGFYGGSYEHPAGWFWIWGVKMERPPTHWMPLPEPPKGP